MDQQITQPRPEFIVETKSLRTILADLKKAEMWLTVAAIAAFLASAFFVVKYFVGGSMHPAEWTGEQWANAMLGLGITAVITGAQAALYASGYKGPAAVLATIIVVFFGLFSEISQSMEREDATVRQRSESSPVFQAALGSIQNLSAQAAAPMANPYSTQITDAEVKLAQCQERLRQGREKHCKGSQQRVDSLRKQAQDYASDASASTNSALTAAISQAKTLEYDEDKHYAMIRLIRNLFGLAGIYASFMFSLIIIGTFEYAFHFVGAYVADHKRALLMMGRDSNGELLSDSHDSPPDGTGGGNGNKSRAHSKYLNWVTPEKHEKSSESHGPSSSTGAAASAQQENHVRELSELSRERFFKLLYMEIRNRVINGDLLPSIRPVTDAVTEVIRHHTKALGLQPSLIGEKERQKIAGKILEKLAQESIVNENREAGPGQPKYLLASRWANRPAPDLPVKPPRSTVRQEMPKQPQMYPGNRSLDSAVSPTTPVASAASALERAQQRWADRPAIDGNTALKIEPETTVPVQQITVPETVEAVDSNESGTVGTVSDELYRQYRSEVMAKRQKFTVRPTRDWLKARGIGGSNATREAQAVKMIARLVKDQIIERAHDRSDTDPRGPYKLIGRGD